MEDFNQNNDSLEQKESIEETVENLEDFQEVENNDEEPFEEMFSENEEFSLLEPSENAINYTEVKPNEDEKSTKKGLKVFAGIMAAVILVTAASITGYFFGKNNIGGFSNGTPSADLSARPNNTEQLTPAQVYEKVNDSIVGITVYNAKGDASQASGVFYSNDGYIVTNDHIYSEIPAAKFKIYTADGKEYSAKFVAGDKVSDLAVLKINSGSFKKADFGDSSQIFHGENVVAIGRPSDASNNSSITSGVISSTGRRVQGSTNYSSKLIQTDSAINPGSSGGALVNMYGQVIGITSSKLAGVNYDAVGYAIPTTTMKRVVDELISKGKVLSRAKLGITYTAIDSITAEINNKAEVGLYVASVSEDSDLYGKVTEGDIITHINSVAVTRDDVVLDIIDESYPGDKILVTFINKQGIRKQVKAVLKANTSESSYTTNSKEEKNDETFKFPFGE